MLNLKKLALAGLLLSSVSSSAFAQSYPTTASIFADVLTQGMIQGAEEDLPTPLTPAQLDCFKTESHDQTVDAMQATLLTIVTPSELAQVDAFMQSRLGRQVTQALTSNAEASVDDMLAQLDLNDVTPAEEAAFEKFYHSSAYKKLFKGDRLTTALQSKATMHRVLPIAMNKIISCDIPLE